MLPGYGNGTGYMQQGMRVALWLLACGCSAGILIPGEGTKLRVTSHELFATHEPETGIHSWHVSYDLEGTGGSFVLLLATPARARAEAVSSELFTGLNAFTRLKERRQPISPFLGETAPEAEQPAADPPGLRELTLLTAESLPGTRVAQLYDWLASRQLNPRGKETTIAEFALDRWFFTALYFDADYAGRSAGAHLQVRTVPVAIQFRYDGTPTYPLRTFRASGARKLPTTLYIQDQTKMDLPEDLSYQFYWIDHLRKAQVTMERGQPVPWGGEEWLERIRPQIGSISGLSKALGFDFEGGARGEGGISPSILKWSKALDEQDIQVAKGQAPYSDGLPNVDEGLEHTDRSDREAMAQTVDEIRRRLERSRAFRPQGYLWREATAEEQLAMRKLARFLRPGQTLTRIEKSFHRGEFAQNFQLQRAGWDRLEDDSEYIERLLHPADPR